MSNDLRAPDPTLDAYVADPNRYFFVELSALDVALPTAHRMYGCGAAIAGRVPAEIARWVAVPCHECWPEAPPSGTIPYASWPHHSPIVDTLAWQVAEVDA